MTFPADVCRRRVRRTSPVAACALGGVVRRVDLGQQAGVVGPLIEVPVLVGLVYVSLLAGRRLFPGDPTVPAFRA